MTAPILLALCAVAAAPAPVAVPKKLAMPAFNLVHVDESNGAFYGHHLAQQLELQGFQVTTPQQIGAVLGLERQKELLGCNEDSCLAEMANALGVDALLTGELAHVDEGFQLNLKVFSARDAHTLAAYSTHVSREAELLASLNWAAQVLAARMRGEPEPSRPTVRRFAWIPAVAGAALLVGGGVCTLEARGAYAALTPPQSPPLTAGDAQLVADGGKGWQTLSAVGYGLGAAALVGAAVLYVAGAPAESQVALSVGPTGAMISGVLP